MTRAGRAIHVQFVMTAKMIYAALALDLPVWAIKAIDKLRKGFLWRAGKSSVVVIASWLGLRLPVPRSWVVLGLVS